MQLDLVVRGAGTSTPVTVLADDTACVAELRSALAAMLGVPPALLDLPAPDEADLRTAGLVPGAVISSTGPAFPAGPPGEWQVRVVGGLHGGLWAPLAGAEVTTIGRADSCGLAVPDPQVSRVHVRVRPGRRGDDPPEVADAGSANGTRLGAYRLDVATPVTGADLIGAGESVFALRRPVRADGEVAVAAEPGVRLFNRPPRLAVPERLVEVTVPVAPAEWRGLRFPWLATLVPAVLCGALYVVLPGGYGGYLILMLALSPLMALINVVSDRRKGRQDYRAAAAAYVRERAAFDRALIEAAAAEESADRANHPDPTELVHRTGAWIGRPSARLWERRRADGDFLRLRVGLVDRPARLILRPAAGSAVTQPSLPTVRDVAVTVDLPDAGVLGLAGPRAGALAAGRAIIGQAAILHSPAELGLVVVTGRDTAPDWEWATWLPHTVPASATFACVRMVATDAAQAEARLAEIRRLVEERTADRRSALAQGAGPGRVILLVLDGARRLRDLAGLAEVLSQGPAVGVYALCLDSEANALPDECGATIVLDNPAGTRATVRRKALSSVDDVLVDGLATEAAVAAALALAPLRPHGERLGDSALPDQVRFLDLVGLADADAAAVSAGWRRQPAGRSTVAVLGMAAAGPVTVDLRRDGPHALVAGTSGAGKSELLQTLVTSLALVNEPDALTFVLVDYKGGSAFAACAELPHAVGLVTDLDGHLVGRALASLSAELRRRESLFAEAGAKDIDDYWARTGARLPRLVIVVDEFASLVEELPEFVPGVVGIGMRGRSLGVHVILATQRPAGVITADMRANINLRISLRVTAAAESVDVIDAADAARILPSQPGRAFVRTGHGELTGFQAARISWPRPPVPPTGSAKVTVRPRRVEDLGRRPGGPSVGDADHDTDLTELTRAVREAAARHEPPPSPWLPPLPEAVLLAPHPVTTNPVAAVLGLIDRPSAQAQEPFLVDLAATGPLVVAGAVRAGRSTALRTLAAALARGTSPADLHLYALDCGNQALLPLAALPHCGGVVDGDEPARVERLLDLLQAEVSARQRRFTAAGHASLAEQRAADGDPLPHVVVLVDRLEAFLARYADLDGGRLVDRLEALLRSGPPAGITLVLSSDRTGFHHRVASAVAARLVLRQAMPDDAAAFGVDPRTMPARLPAGRGIWAATGEEVQVALLDSDPAGSAQAAAVARLATALSSRWDGVDRASLPRRLDPLPEVVATDAVEALRRLARPPGSAVCTPGVGGDQLGPVDVDLADAGATFLIAGPQRSGRSTALAAIAVSLAGRPDATLPVLVVAPRPSVLRKLAGLPGILGVLDGDPAAIATHLLDAAALGPMALIIDDAELLTDPALTGVLETFARQARDRGSLLVAAATTEDVLANAYRGWLAAARRSRSGLLLNPASHVDGEVFGLRLARSVNGGWPPGRAMLVTRGEVSAIQVAQLGRNRADPDRGGLALGPVR